MPYCERCYAETDHDRGNGYGLDIQPVEPKFGFGCTRTRWLPVKNWCSKCRAEQEGRWRKAPGFVDAKKAAKAVADPELFGAVDLDPFGEIPCKSH